MNPQQEPNQYPQPDPPPRPTPAPPVVAQQEEPRYSTGTPAYDPNYLDSISAGPPAQKFFSGSFGKIFFIMLGLFALAVSLIVAFSGKDNTAILQKTSVRLENIARTTKTIQKDINSNNLKEINTKFNIWATNSQRDAEDLLKLGGVQRTDFNKEMVRTEEARIDELNSKFEDARLSVRLHRVYSTTMDLEIEGLLNLFATLSKNPSSKIRDFANTAVKNVKPIQKEFNEYVDDGN